MFNAIVSWMVGIILTVGLILFAVWLDASFDKQTIMDGVMYLLLVVFSMVLGMAIHLFRGKL